MKATGPLNERETIVRWSDEDDSVEVWTASGRTERVCRRLGFDCVEEGERHAVFKVTTRNITLRRKRTLTGAQVSATRDRLAKARSTRLLEGKTGTGAVGS